MASRRRLRTAIFASSPAWRTTLVSSFGEETKVAVRNLRRDANEHLKKMLKDKQVAEDEERRAQDDVQKLTDRTVAEIDKLVHAKEAEVLAV